MTPGTALRSRPAALYTALIMKLAAPNPVDHDANFMIAAGFGVVEVRTMWLVWWVRALATLVT
jgi:hypothetical protein